MSPNQTLGCLLLFLAGMGTALAIDLSIPHTHENGWLSNQTIPDPQAKYCFETQVYTESPYGAVLVGDQLVCLGPMKGPSKKGRVD